MKISVGLGLGLLALAVSYGCQVEERNFGEPLDTGGTNAQGGDGNQMPQGGSEGMGEAGAGATMTGGSGNTTGVVAVIDATPDFAGLRVELDASGSSSEVAGDLSYEWSIEAVPDGSSVTNGVFLDPTAEALSFFSDLGGDYTLGLTVTDAGGQSASTTATVTVPTFDVPYFAVSGNASGSTRTPTLVKSDGTGPRELGCFFTEPAANEHEWLLALGETGQFQIDSFYSTDPMVPSGLAFLRRDLQNQGGRLLQLASSATDCDQARPAEIIAVNLPRYSPNGKRVAFFTQREVVTASSEGTAIRVVRPVGGVAHTLTSTPPFWIDNQTVGWVELDDSGDQVIYSAPDESDGFNNLIERKIFTNCGEVGAPFFQIKQVEMSAAGLIISALPTNASTGTTLFLLEDVGGGKYSCQRANTPSNVRLTGVNSNTQDFDVSPDGTQVVFVRRLDDTDAALGPRASILLTMPADGSADPVVLYGDDAGEPDANTGPRWAADGKQVIWSRTTLSNKDENTQRPQRSYLMIINADGTNPRVLDSVQSNVGTARALLTGANGCSLARPNGGWAALASALLLGAGLLRRRRAPGSGPRVVRRFRLGITALVGVLLLVAAPAQAQTDQERAAARAAANQGGDAYDAGRYEEALQSFQNAERLVHALPHLLYIARASEKLGKLVEAREAYLKIQRETLKPTDPPAFREAQEAANKELPLIEPRLATVTLKLEGATAQEATVTVDGNPISAGLVGLPTPTNPGEHVFEAKAPGKLPASQRITLAEGAKQTVTLALQVDPNAAAAPPAGDGAAPAPGGSQPLPGEADRPAAKSSLKVPAYIALGVGAVGLGVGTVFLIGGLGDSSDADGKFDDCLKADGNGDDACNDAAARKDIEDLDESAASKKTLATVGFAVGGAALATGVILLVVDSGKKSDTAHHRKAPRLTPHIGFNYVGLSGTF